MVSLVFDAGESLPVILGGINPSIPAPPSIRYSLLASKEANATKVVTWGISLQSDGHENKHTQFVHLLL